MKYCLYVSLCFLIYFPLKVNAQNQPNILLIIADDLGIDGLDGYNLGVTPAITPTLDSLRAEGITYINAWATPQCAPTRSSIISGKYGVKNGVRMVPGHLDLQHESIFSYVDRMTDNAYASAVIGKWHISSPQSVEHISDHGVDYFEGILGGGVNNYFRWSKFQDGEEVTINDYVTSHLTDAAINWIGDQDQPWFLWLAHVAPHLPLHVPPSDLLTGEEPITDRQMFLAAIEALDHEIGRLLNSMDEETRENTFIIIVGDNGSPRTVSAGFPRGHAKGTLYEGGVRVPMILSGSGVTRSGQQEIGLVQVNDLYATIIEVVGEDLEGGIYNSYSLRPSLNRRNQIERSYIYTDYIDDNIEFWAIRNQDYKLILNDLGEREFYDLRNNIDEDQNLIDNLSPAQNVILEVLESEARDIREGWSCQDLILNGDEEEIDDCNLSTNIDIDNLIELTIYPNPASETMRIELKGTDNYMATIIDNIGQIILREITPEYLSIGEVPPGIYLLEIVDLDSDQKVVETIYVTR